MKLKLNNLHFVLLLLVAAGVGVAWHQGADQLSQYRQWLLFGVMVMIGLEQHLPSLAREGRKLGAISLSLGVSFLLFPIVSGLIGLLFFSQTDTLGGFVVMAVVPVTLTSAVIYTRLDRGNDKLALVIVLLSQLISVALTPLLIAVFLAETIAIPILPMIWQLIQFFLVPLALGMVLAALFPLKRIAPYLPLPEQVVIALFVMMGAGHVPHDTAWWTLGKAVIAVLMVQMVMAIMVRSFIKRFTPRDQTALFFTSTQKTMTVGLYILLSYFPDAAVLPMVLYHLAQLSLGRFYWLPPKSCSD